MASLLHKMGLRFEGDTERAFRDWYHARYFRTGRVAAIVAIVGWFATIAWDITVISAPPGVIWLRVGTTAIAFGLAAALFTGWGERHWHSVVAAIAVMAGAAMAWMHVLIGARGVVGVSGVCLVVFGVSTILDLRVVYGAPASAVVAAAHWLASLSISSIATAMLVNDLIWLLLALAMGTFASYMLERSRRDAFTAEQRTEQLIDNLLPHPIAERLRDGPESIADAHAGVSVVFADIVGFSRLARELPAAELVGLLDRIFAGFDAAATRHDVEKIKTVGDEYMAAAGVPVPRADHAAAAARLAADMHDIISDIAADTGHDLALRIGIHSGPVVAGTLGKSRLHYDLWGQTVNLASRMESHGEPGKTQITAATRALLADDFHFEPRGGVDVKGHGAVDTFFLSRRNRGRGAREAS